MQLLFGLLAFFLTAPCHAAVIGGPKFAADNTLRTTLPRDSLGFEIEAEPLKYAPIGDFISAYTIPLAIGSSEDIYKLLFDTGSPTFWVISDLSAESELPEVARKYHFQQEVGQCLQPGEIEYESTPAHVSGFEAKDTVGLKAVGGDFARTKFDFLAAKTTGKLSLPFVEAGIQGVFASSNSPVTWIAGLPSGAKKFLVNFNRQGTSNILVGDKVDTMGTSAGIQAFDVTNEYQRWVLPSDEFGDVLFDTGSSALLLPPQLVQGFFGNLQPRLGIEFKQEGRDRRTLCDANIPKITAKIKGVPFSIPGSNLIGPRIPQYPGWCLSLLRESPFDFSLIGLPFFWKYNVIFDYEKPSISIVNKPKS